MLGAGLTLGAGSALAGFTVDTTADERDTQPGDGRCLTGTGRCSLRAAIQELNTSRGGEIILPKATYLLTLTGQNEDGAAVGDLDVRADITISGDGAATTLIDASPMKDRVFDVQLGASAGKPRLILSGMGITGGVVSGVGGGIRTAGAVYLVRSELFRNEAAAGGGVAGRQVNGKVWGRLICVLSTIAGNVAFGRGGGVDGTKLALVSMGSGNATDDGCRVSNNQAEEGGGIVSAGRAANGWSATTITASTIADNAASVGAGLLGGGTINRTTFSGNRADELGGAMAQAGGLIQNSTFSGNRAPRGGGISGGGGNGLTVRFSTFALNGGLTSTARSAGAHFSWRESGSARLILANSLIALGGGLNNGVGALCDAAAGRIASSGYNLAADSTCQLTATRDQMGNPILRVSYDLQDNGGPTRTHRLEPGSIAIDRGNEERGRPATDQRGFRRPAQYAGSPDTGAFEFGATAP